MIQNLNQREKLFLSGGAISLLLLIIIFGMILPYRSTMANLDDRIVQRQQQLEQLRAIQVELLQLQGSLALREQKLARSGNSSAFSSIESIVTRLGIRDKLVAMRPQPSGVREGMQVESVATRIDGITLDDLVSLLRAFESSNTLLNVKGMKIKTRFDDPSQLDAELQVETLKRSS